MILIAQLQVSTPKTAQDLAKLMEQREELNAQLRRHTQDRGDLANQIQGLGDPAVRSGPLARIKSLDDRIAILERDEQTLDKVIADAKAKGIGQDEATVYVTAPPAMPPFPQLPPTEVFPQQPPTWRDRLVDSLPVTAPITLASVVLLGAFLIWRISRSARNQFATLLALQQSRLEELQRSVDSVAVEMERVSENQRFVTKLVGDRAPAERR
jgi:hypothetical protein